MVWCAIILVVLVPIQGYGQNLVANGGFEIYNVPPNFMGQINRALGWSNLNGFYPEDNPCPFPILCATPDYFHDLFLPPISWTFFNQSAFEGTGFANFANAIWSSSPQYEYLHYELAEPLVVGREYEFSFYLSIGEIVDSSFCLYATNNIGVLFSNYLPFQAGSELVARPPQINIQQVVSHFNWELYLFDFIADSAYNHLTIGNFYSSIETNTSELVDCSNLSLFNRTSHYFIDNVSLYSKDSGNSTNEFHNLDLFKSIALLDSRQIRIELSRHVFSAKIELADITGRLLERLDNLSGQSLFVNVDGLPQGIYSITIKTNEGVVIRKILTH